MVCGADIAYVNNISVQILFSMFWVCMGWSVEQISSTYALYILYIRTIYMTHTRARTFSLKSLKSENKT